MLLHTLYQTLVLVYFVSLLWYPQTLSGLSCVISVLSYQNLLEGRRHRFLNAGLP